MIEYADEMPKWRQELTALLSLHREKNKILASFEGESGASPERPRHCYPIGKSGDLKKDDGCYARALFIPI